MEKGHAHDLNVKSVDRISTTRVRLTIEFTGDAVKDHEQMMANRYLLQAKIPGFRPGKAPIKMIKERYKEEIRRDVVSHLLEAGLSEALQKTQLNPVSRPQIQLQEIAEGKPFGFQAEFDIQPEIELKNYKEIPLKKSDSEPSEEEIGKTIDNLRDRFAVLEPLAADHAEKGQFAVVDIGYEVKDSDQKKEEAKPYTVEVGMDKLLPSLDKALLEMKTGEERKITETFPADYTDKKLAGKEAIFDCKLVEVKKKVLPEVNDAFANQLREGLTLEALKKDVSENIRQSKLQEAQRAQRQAIIDYLIEHNKFDVPATLIEEQTGSLLQWMAEDLKKRGLTPQQLKADEMTSVRQRAENMVRSSLLLKEVAEKEKIALDEQRLQAKIDAIAGQLDRSVEETKKFLAGKGMMQRIRDEILTDQVFDFLAGNARLS